MTLALGIGVGAGVGAAALIYALRVVSNVVEEISDIGSLTQSWVFIVIPIGIWLAWLVTSRWAPEAAGHGVPQILTSLTLQGGNIAPRIPALKTIATALTIGVGGSAGREGSIAQIGADRHCIGCRCGRLPLANRQRSDVPGVAVRTGQPR